MHHKDIYKEPDKTGQRMENKEVKKRYEQVRGIWRRVFKKREKEKIEAV